MSFPICATPKQTSEPSEPCRTYRTSQPACRGRPTLLHTARDATQAPINAGTEGKLDRRLAPGLASVSACPRGFSIYVDLWYVGLGLGSAQSYPTAPLVRTTRFGKIQVRGVSIKVGVCLLHLSFV